MSSINDRAAAYGARFTNALEDGNAYHGSVDHSITYTLRDPEVVKITRLRLIGYNSREFPFWDLSYCHGQLADGTTVPVQLDRYQFTRNYKRELVELAKDAGRFAKGLGLIDDSVISLLYG